MPKKKEPKARSSEIRQQIIGLDMLISDMMYEIEELNSELKKRGEEPENTAY